MDAEDTMPTPTRSDGRFTYDDFLLFPDDGKRHEIIDGEHYVTPSPNARHQLLVGELHFALAVYLRTNPAVGVVFLAPFDVVFSNWDVLEPDLLFIADDQRHILTEKNVQGAPALVIEVLSPGTRTRDEGIKRQLFERSGVREYWLVNPDVNAIHVYRRTTDDAFPRVAVLTAADRATLDTPLLPGFALALEELFVERR
jgi:Uma2 family endonuclease